MNTYDPHIVAQALEDLQSEITRWSSIASDMLATAIDTQRHAKESVDRALHKAAIVLDRAKDDEESVPKVLSFVATAIEKCTTAATTAHNTLKEAQNVLAEANATLQKWRAELEKALAWLASAEARLANAIEELDSACSALTSAEEDLSSAESSYDDCMNDNDKERSNCSDEAAAVSSARAEVASARQWVRAAEQKVNAATAEVEQAEARVTCCQRAIAFSTEAVNLTQESVSSATQAINSAERSLEFARAGERLVNIAQKKMLAELESAENIMLETRAAQEFTDSAAKYLRNVDQTEDAAQIYATSVRKELEYRLQRLQDFNRFSLDPGDWSLPKNVSPSEIKVKTRSDGKTSVVYGDKRNESGKITSEHGHTVINNDGEIDYARTQRQTVKKDRQENVLFPLQQISLSDIEDIPYSDLKQDRLDMLLNGYSSFDDVLNNSSDPVCLDKGGGKPYRIVDGRHRIYLARKKGFSTIPVRFI